MHVRLSQPTSRRVEPPLSLGPRLPRLRPVSLLVTGPLVLSVLMVCAPASHAQDSRPQILEIPPLEGGAPAEPSDEPASPATREESFPGVRVPSRAEADGARRESRLKNRDAQILLDYREVLLDLAAGDKAAAEDGLHALEQWVLESYHPKDAELLFDSEAQVIAWLARRDPETLVPLLWLHHDSYAGYLGRGENYLASHARKITGSLALLYGREGGPEAKALGSQVLTSLGLYAMRAGVVRESLGLLETALELDPDNDVALLGIAVSHERAGGHERAAERLARLVAAHPNHREGRLRLGVNLARGGDLDGARAQFAHLLDPVAPADWVDSLAHQEMARLLTQDGDWRRAQEILFAALDRGCPGSARLRTQLAFVLDNSKAPVQALRVMEEVAGLATEEEPSPRLLYGRGPQEETASLRASLEESATGRLPQLASVLQSYAASEIGAAA